jgi:predicted HTH transcriptional regulator
MEAMEINQLLIQPESKILEFKRDLSSLGPILKTIVAFANNPTCPLSSLRRVAR